jgi:hypothetical protein
VSGNRIWWDTDFFAGSGLPRSQIRNRIQLFQGSDPSVSGQNGCVKNSVLKSANPLALNFLFVDLGSKKEINI